MERITLNIGMTWGTWEEILEALKFGWRADIETTLHTREFCYLKGRKQP